MKTFDNQVQNGLRQSSLQNNRKTRLVIGRVGGCWEGNDVRSTGQTVADIEQLPVGFTIGDLSGVKSRFSLVNKIGNKTQLFLRQSKSVCGLLDTSSILLSPPYVGDILLHGAHC